MTKQTTQDTEYFAFSRDSRTQRTRFSSVPYIFHGNDLLFEKLVLSIAIFPVKQGYKNRAMIKIEVIYYLIMVLFN